MLSVNCSHVMWGPDGFAGGYRTYFEAVFQSSHTSLEIPNTSLVFTKPLSAQEPGNVLHMLSTFITHLG